MSFLLNVSRERDEGAKLLFFRSNGRVQWGDLDAARYGKDFYVHSYRIKIKDVRIYRWTTSLKKSFY